MTADRGSASDQAREGGNKRRRRIILAAATAGAVGLAAALAVVFLRGPGPLASGGGPLDPRRAAGNVLTECPLTGVDPQGDVPDRPPLAIKVENLPVARPQIGLSHADIIYEEPVEAGITRFIVVYQCHDAERVEPVRSARLTDPGVLVQFGRPLFAYAGGVPKVVESVRRSHLLDVNFNTRAAMKAYHRDPNRPSPHNLYTGTSELYRAAGSPRGAPRPIFDFSRSVGDAGRKVLEVHLPFSSSSDVRWTWDAAKGAFLRFHGDQPHTYSDGTQVSAKNVVVQVVKVVTTNIHDVNGVASPEAVTTGSGKAYVLRNGRMIKGTWKRPKMGDVTRFLDSKGRVIPLAPGNTWVELLPSNIRVTSK